MIAWLRPIEDAQTDKADLMPYPVLHATERSAIAEQFPDESLEQLKAWIDRSWCLWRASQWKREPASTSTRTASTHAPGDAGRS